MWEPIPRDRDHAFTRFDGVIPSVVEYYSKVAGFDQSYAPIDKMTYTGRFTDRRFLVGLEKTQWEAVTSELVARLTDQVISDAVHCLPQPVYDKDGADLEKALRSRRDALPAVSREYYRLLADRVDVRGTGQDEDFRVEREANGAVEIGIHLRDGKTGEKTESPYFHRTFQPDETSEIRLYTTGGADRILVDGKTDRTIPVRVVAPAKAVDITDRSSQPSAIHVYAPLPDDPLPAPLPGTGPLRGEVHSDEGTSFYLMTGFTL